MDWILRSPQIHSVFGNLGFIHGDGYHINENCNAALETILHNILTEDKYLRTYRRSISFGQNIQKDLVPLLLQTKDDKTIELLIKILVNLTVPIECLLSVDAIAKTDFGRHTIFEINNLLSSAKVAFTDIRVTKVIIEYFKKNVDFEQTVKLTAEQCLNIGNGLLLLRNILHIPEEPALAASLHTVQNQILWNIFSQSIDKVLIKMMTIPEAANWSVTMVQIIGLLYKDQHVGTLHKLLNLWLDTSLSESSEDNESNTSPPDRGSEDSSPMLTSSDSSDTGGGSKSSGSPAAEDGSWHVQPPPPPPPDSKNAAAKRKHDDTRSTSTCDEDKPESSSQFSQQEKKSAKGDNSDCGYGTQIENQESVSTSSNEDEPQKKPVHQKPNNPKQKPNNKVRFGTTLHDRKRRKIVKRAKATIINVQGLSRKTPTDDDISNVLKEFTVDFLLKGYNSLVRTLHNQILTNVKLEIDTSHFFWLVTYFLKFAAQIELDLDHVCSVLSLDIIAYLTAEGVNLCEQFELAIKLDSSDLKPSSRRLHLVVTAIREFVQAIEVYKKLSLISNENKETLIKLQFKICKMEELRSLMILLLRHYNPKYNNKQYLQDLIVTNHNLLLFVDSVIKYPDYKGTTKMADHIKQFATPEMMYQYGLLLEDYAENGEFVNDCIFTLMHHVGGDLGSIISLFQPSILKTFTSIWKSEFEICDDWSDLIEYVINTFIKKPQSIQGAANFCLDTECFEDERTPVRTRPATDTLRWSESELSALRWNYMQCNLSADVVGEIVQLFKEDGTVKSRDAVIRELLNQDLISKQESEAMLRSESERAGPSPGGPWPGGPSPGGPSPGGYRDAKDDEISKLCSQLVQDGKAAFLHWMQAVLLDICHANICLSQKAGGDDGSRLSGDKLQNFELFKKKQHDMPLVSPVSYHSLLVNQSVPLVPWNFEQASICKDLNFLQLLNKLGFHMPVDTGKVFIRIPQFWSAEYLYDLAGKILPIDTSKLSFSMSDLSAGDARPPPADDYYQIHKQTHFATVLNYTPMIEEIPAHCGPDKDNNNLCDTASVASDLTRMYVSDEDDKPDRSDHCDAAKRPRVNFAHSF